MHMYDNFVQVKIDGLDYNTIKEIDLGLSTQNNSAMVKTTTNRIFKSGNNSFGLLGVEEKNKCYSTFVEITNYNDIWKNNKKVINGVIVSYVLTNDGKLYTYSNNSNMTGVGATDDFKEIKFEGATVEQIETLDGLSLALLSNEEVYGWGYNTYGILGDGYDLGGVYSTPVKLNLSNVRYMSLGEGFAIFATHAGKVYGIGKNDYGQLGTGDNKGASTFVRCEELEK